jgi:hypothetical protein
MRGVPHRIFPRTEGRVKTLFSSPFHRSTQQTLLSSILFAGLFHAVSTPARAEVQVTGVVDAVRLEARDASLEQVFGALCSVYNLRYRMGFSRTPLVLKDSINGIYQGPLWNVVSHLLQGYDFVIVTSAGNIDVKVYGASKLDDSYSGPPQSVCTRRTRVPSAHSFVYTRTTLPSQ